MPSPWDLGNNVLYTLCTSRPNHVDLGEVLAKIWLIGRSYAAAIERRRNKKADELNDDFYVTVAGPLIIASKIDQWLSNARAASRAGVTSQDVLLEVHCNTTKLFKEISQLDKRSLASKYLHFHVPDLFYIYDKRAVEAMRQLAPLVGRASRSSTAADNEYRKFVEKCVTLKRVVQEEFGQVLNPRELDKLLLQVHASLKSKTGN